jgi:polysaccharide biosynthesis transport protein
MTLQEKDNGRPPRPGYPYPAATSHVDEGGMGLQRAINALMRHWWYPVMGAAAALVIAWFWIPHDLVRYRASAVIRLDDSRQALAGSIAGGATENIRAPEFMISQVHVIRSQAVLGQVVDSLGLRLQPGRALEQFVAEASVEGMPRSNLLKIEFERGGYAVQAGGTSMYGLYGTPVDVDGVRFTIVSEPPLDTATMFVIPREAAIQFLAGGLTASHRDRTSIIDITYTGTDPARTRQAVNAVALAYQNHNMAGVREAARRRREFLETQWRVAEARHDEAQRRLNVLRAPTRLDRSQEMLRQQQAGLIALEQEQRQVQAERRVFQAFLQRVNNAPDERIFEELRTLVLAPEAAGSPLLSQLYAQLTQHEEERQRLLAAGRSATHPDVERLNRLIGSARSSIVDAAGAQLKSLDLRFATLDEQRVTRTAALQGMPDAASEDLSLTQEVSTARGMADALQGDYFRARIAEAVDAGQAEILEFAAAAVPLPAGRRAQQLGIAIMLGLMLGGGTALGLEVTDRSIRWRGELKTLSPLPALAVIPRVIVPVKKPRRHLGRKRGASRVVPGGNVQKDQLPALDFHTVGAEAYRVLRTNLTFLRGEEPLRSLAVTSAASGEGKSTTVANLAASLARQNVRVLVVDCDLRRPRQHRIFGIAEGRPGLVEVLLGELPAADAIYQTGVEGLQLMPRGTFKEKAAEMLGGQQMRGLVAHLQDCFDVVIVDTPPTLVAADAAAVGAVTDGVLFVVRAGRTQRDAVSDALQQLESVGGRVIGFVLNDPDAVAYKFNEYKYMKSYYAVEK